MKQDLLEQAISQVRNEPIDSAVAEKAAERVRARILAPARKETGLHLIQGCGEFQEFIPAYVAGTLSYSRRLLLEDHIVSCVHCRHALETARTGKVRVLPRPVVTQRSLPPYLKVGIAAMVALIVGASGWNLYRVFAPDQSVSAVVKSVSGEMFLVGDVTGVPIFAGRKIAERQHVRTREKSDALILLGDGSEVELNAHSEVWFSRVSRETTIHVARGSVIVHAAKQRNGALHVATRDCLVTVKGTIFAVNSGVKGSRVSVVEGAVQVEQGRKSRMLHPGEQATTSTAVQTTTVSEEVSWSRNASEYLAVLGEFSNMAKQLAQVPQPGLRYSSKLAGLAPPNTVLYAAIPNVGPLLSEANRIFSEHLNQSEVLSQWWKQHHPEDGPGLDDMVQRIRGFSDYLGDEIALAVTIDGETKDIVPLIMAEVKQAGLRDFLQGQLQHLNSGTGRAPIEILDQLPSTAPASTEGRLYAYVSGNYLLLSTNLSLLGQADAASRREAPVGAYRLYSRIEQAYQSGAGWLLAADMEQIRSNSVKENHRKPPIPTGIDTLETVVLERKDVNGTTQSLASLGFHADRTGMAGWLAAPAPMGSLEFMSPNASLVTAAVTKGHGQALWELLESLKATNPAFGDHVQQFQNNNGWRILRDLADSLGSDFAFAVDGALIPVPSWKLAIEVYSPNNFQWAIEQLVDGINQQPETKSKLTLQKKDLNGRTFYAITADASPVQMHYTFVDSYLVAAANESLLTQAIQNRQTGFTLTRSEKFRSQLPTDGRLDFSAIAYVNAGPALELLAGGASATNAMTPAQKQAVAALAANSKPGLVYAYGEPNRILVSSTGSFFGLSIDTLSLPAILATSGMLHPGSNIAMDHQQKAGATTN